MPLSRETKCLCCRQGSSKSVFVDFHLLVWHDTKRQTKPFHITFSNISSDGAPPAQSVAFNLQRQRRWATSHRIWSRSWRSSTSGTRPWAGRWRFSSSSGSAIVSRATKPSVTWPGSLLRGFSAGVGIYLTVFKPKNFLTNKLRIRSTNEYLVITWSILLLIT